jgi:hypothetical protein
MIDLHGQAKWDEAVAQQQAIDDAGGVQESRQLTPEEREALILEKIEAAAPIGTGLAVSMMLLGLVPDHCTRGCTISRTLAADRRNTWRIGRALC